MCCMQRPPTGSARIAIRYCRPSTCICRRFFDRTLCKLLWPVLRPRRDRALLESSVAGVFDINIQLLRNINKERYAKNQKVQYIKCPVCRNFMRRVNFGHRSGVVVDRCREHGVWLDNGEIAHLLEWKKAGGQMLHERQLRRERETGKNRKRESWRGSPVDVAAGHGYPESFSGRADEELLSMVSTAIFRLFR